MSTIKDRFSSRKLFFALLLLGLATAYLLLTEDSSFTEWADFAKWIFGIYAAGNVGTEVAKQINVYPNV